MRFSILGLAVFVGLSGCGLSVSIGQLGERIGLNRTLVPESIALGSGAIEAAGPQGYCVDTSLSRPTRGFAVLASCAVLSDADVTQSASGIITVQTGDAGSAIVTGTEDALVGVLRSTEGRSILSANGVADSINIDSIDSQTGVVIVTFRDAGAPAIAGTADTEWRAFVDLAGRLTTIGVRGFAETPISPDTGLRVLTETVRQMQTRNQ